MGFIQRLKAIGPGAMIAAAFIGPGTVTTASVTGARFGYALIWTLVFSIIATIILQEMSARLGLISRDGLGEAIHEQFDNEFAKWGAIVLVVAAIGIGTAAYEAGNLTGGAAGLQTITGVNSVIWAILIAVVATALLYTGKYEVIERGLVSLVVIMAVAFLGSALLIGPNLGALALGFVPGIPEGSLILVTGLIGTTVVGYNLFLHASNVQERWTGSEKLTECRTDTILSIIVGGIITLAVLVTAAAAFPRGTEISNVGRLAEQLRPVAGPYATLLFSIGLFAAGFTSATTAPLAGAYATAGALGWETDLTDTRFRTIWGVIILVGFISVLLGGSPVEIILFAQVINGILLPIVAVFLILAMNSTELLNEYTNSTLTNVVGGIVVTIVIWLGIRTLLTVTGVL